MLIRGQNCGRNKSYLFTCTAAIAPRGEWRAHTHHRFSFWREGPCVRCTPSPVNTSPLKDCVSAITVTSHMVMNKFCWKPFELFLYHGWQICQGEKKKKTFQFLFLEMLKNYRLALPPADGCSRPWKLISVMAAFKAKCSTMSWSCFLPTSGKCDRCTSVLSSL